MRADIRAVLFDLDGTLIDSAPDLAASVNALRLGQNLEPVAFERLRRRAGSGARGMLDVAFGLKPADAGYESLRELFYQQYAQRFLQTTRMFPDIDLLLGQLGAAGLPWGIVTNKAMRFADPGVRALGLQDRCSALIAGDTTAHTKPHPEPLLAAASCLQVPPEACVYVGDDPRDVEAGRSAGMFTLAASWGYLGDGLSIDDWGADAVLQQPLELLQWLELA